MNFILFLDNIYGGLKGLIYFFVSGLFMVILLAGCSPTRNLKENQYLLYTQKIRGNKKISRDSYAEIYKQRPNRKILGLTPYLGIYNLGRKFYDSSKVLKEIAAANLKYNQKIARAKSEYKRNKLEQKKNKKLENLAKKQKDGNWLMRTPGEPPSIFDSATVKKQVDQFQLFLYSRGFFHSSVKAEIDTIPGRRIEVKYRISEGKPHMITQFSYELKEPDKVIDSLLESSVTDAAVKPGEPYNADKLSEERERINNLLKNNGYFDFSRQYVFFEVDTLKGPYSVGIKLSIEPPAKGETHKQYQIGDIFFDGDASLSADKKRDTLIYNDINMVMAGQKYSGRILNHKIRMRPGQLYRQEDIQLTQKDLATLDMFKFVNINYEKNTKDTTGKTLNAFIKTSPLKKFQLTDEAGLTISSAGFIPGPFGNITLRTRNTFGGFEIFEIGLKASVEGYRNTKDTTGRSSNISYIQEYTGNLSLTFPEFLFPLRIVRYQFRKLSPRTRLLAGATLTSRYEFTRFTVRNSLSYNWNKGEKKNYNLSLIDVSINNTLDSNSAYFETLRFAHENLGSNYIYSFRNSFVSDLNFTYTYNTNSLIANKKSRFFKLYLEPGGTIFNIPGILKDNRLFGLQTYRYVRGNLDMRAYNPVSEKSMMAARFNLGLALPYDTTQALPYEKYFFAGGTNSIRAWRARRLGPGSYSQGLDPEGNQKYVYEQPGEILLESSLEYRFNIFSYFDGAFFIDAGNVWAMNKKTAGNRPGADFQFDRFYRQIAVGTGFGIRMNFSFLVIRFDIGIKTYDPSQKKGERFVLPKIADKPPFGPKNLANINIGIGYPF
jgi:outer membrane protein insertion porin family